MFSNPLGEQGCIALALTLTLPQAEFEEDEEEEEGKEEKEEGAMRGIENNLVVAGNGGGSGNGGGGTGGIGGVNGSGGVNGGGILAAVGVEGDNGLPLIDSPIKLVPPSSSRCTSLHLVTPRHLSSHPLLPPATPSPRPPHATLPSPMTPSIILTIPHLTHPVTTPLHPVITPYHNPLLLPNYPLSLPLITSLIILY